MPNLFTPKAENIRLLALKKIVLFLTFLCFTFSLFSQITYEKGYFIDNAGNRTECLIRNLEWINNPSSLSYKSSEQSEKKTATIQEVALFEIYNSAKFIRSTVQIDKSQESPEKISDTREPIMEEETLFLKVLVDSKASLYEYSENSLLRYFFTTDENDIEQLIYKSYINKEGKIGVNRSYRQQIWKAMNCPDFTLEKVENLSYTQVDLVGYFVDYNSCMGNKFIAYKKQKTNKISFNIRPGISFSSYEAKLLDRFQLSSNFGSSASLRFGIEAEYALPLNKNKWSVFVEPTYQYMKADQVDMDRESTIDYSAIEFSLGARHYIYLNADSKLFLNGSFAFNIPINSTVDLGVLRPVAVDIHTSGSVGLGYKYRNNYSIEFRFAFPRELLSQFNVFDSELKRVSLIFGYKL